MFLIVYNPVSGVSGDDLSDIENLLVEFNKSYDVLLTEDDNTVLDYLSTNEVKYSCIIAAGGDGTISQVINGIVQNEIKSHLLIYPRGTTNEYATSLNVNKDTLTSYLNGDTSILNVDIGKYSESSSFTYSFVFGNFSHVPYETPQWLKNKLGYIAYWIYGFVTLYIFRFKRYEMSFTYNDKTVDGKFLFGSISNSESLGKVIQLNDVSFSDGLMELFLVKSPRSMTDVIRFMHDARTGDIKSGLLIHDKVESVHVESPSPHSWSSDGEYSGSFDSLSIKIVKKAVNIIV